MFFGLLMVCLLLPGMVWAQSMGDAQKLIRQGKLTDAVAVLAKVVAADPSDRNAGFLLANLYASIGQMDRAYAGYQALLAQNSDDDIASRVKEQYLRFGANASDAVRVKELSQQVQAYLRTGRQDEGGPLLEAVIQLAPKNRAALNNLVLLRMQQQKYKDAIKYMERLAGVMGGTQAALHQLAQVYHRAGVIKSAQRAYQAIVKQYPDDMRALTSLARLSLFNDKDYDTAIEYLKRVQKSQPNNAEAIFLLATAYRDQGDPQKALTTFERVVAVKEDHISAWLEIGKLYEQAGRDDSALAAFRQVARYGPGTVEAAQAQRRLALYGSNPAAARKVKSLLKVGLKALADGDLALAKDSLQEVISLVPENVLAHYNLASVYQRDGDTGQAENELREAVRLDETHYLSHAGLGQIHVGSGQYEEAYKDYVALKKWAPKGGKYAALAESNILKVDSALSAFKGTLQARKAFLDASKFAREKNYKEASRLFKKAIEIDPSNPYYWYNSGVIHVELGNLKEAFKAFRKAVSIKPDHMQSHFRLGLFYSATKLHQDAVDSFRLAIKYGSNEPEVAEAKRRLPVVMGRADNAEKATAYLFIANAAAADFDDLELAEKSLLLAQKRRPKSRSILVRLGELMMQKGKPAEARSLLLLGTTLYQDDYRFYFDIAQVDRTLGYNDEAEKYFARVLELKPDLFLAVDVLSQLQNERGKVSQSLETLAIFLRDHPDDELALLTLTAALRKADRLSESAAVIDWYLSTQKETPAVLIERGNIARLMPQNQVIKVVSPDLVATQSVSEAIAEALVVDVPVNPATVVNSKAGDSDSSGAGGVSVLSLEDDGAASVALDLLTTEIAAPRYTSPQDWYRRVIDIAGAEDSDWVAQATRLLKKPKRVSGTISQTVLDYNSNANNSSSDPVSGTSSQTAIALSFGAYRSPRLNLDLSFSTSHRLHYTFQTYVQSNNLSLAPTIRLPGWIIIPPLTLSGRASYAWVRTQRGKSSKTTTFSGTVSSRWRYPRTLTVSYSRSEVVSFTNRANNSLRGSLTANAAHAVRPWVKWALINGSVRYSDRVTDVAARNRDSERTDFTYSGGLSIILPKRWNINGSYFVTESTDSRPTNRLTVTGPVELIDSTTVGTSARLTFPVYPKVVGTLGGSVSVTDLSGVVQRPPAGADGVVPRPFLSDQQQSSFSFTLNFTYRPSNKTSFVVSLGQLQSRASVDVPTDIQDVLTNQVVQENINKRSTASLRMTHSF